MGAVRGIYCALGLLVSSPAQADPIGRWTPLIDEASARFGVPADWIARVMTVESGGRPTDKGPPVRSRAGAMGLMQLMPNTWAAMRDAYDLGFDPDDPHANILAGAAYLRLMYDRFGYPGLFAAYNAGPGRYARALDGRSVLPSETRAYLARLVGTGAIRVSMPTRSPDALFVVRATTPEAPPSQSPAPSLLFVIIRSEGK
jgi:soluble lytic murein transglycosylase-like protein